MNTPKKFGIGFAAFLILIFSGQKMAAQNFNLEKSVSYLKVFGTSNIHDWELTAKDFQGNLEAQLEDGQLVEIAQLNFAVVAESLESGKSGMDKNTIKALRTDRHKLISFQLEKVGEIKYTSKTACRLSTTGNLTIAGTRRLINLVFDAKVSPEKITLTGKHKLKMTDFKIEPPTAMFGTITTGDEVQIEFQTVFHK